jgi:hypothetical protein
MTNDRAKVTLLPDAGHLLTGLTQSILAFLLANEGKESHV